MIFSECLQRANSFLEKRDLKAALMAYDVAQANAQTAHEHMQVLQMKGIAYRLGRQFDEARSEFQQAELLANGNRADVARIHRDLGMVYLDEATFRGGDRLYLQEAERLFFSSRNDLLASGELIEAAVSDGFCGRAFFIRGRRRDAIYVLQAVHDFLNGKNETYELNNLIWLARASIVKRIVYAGRAWELTRKTNPIRWKEYLTILIGGDHLYRFVKKRKGV